MKIEELEIGMVALTRLGVLRVVKVDIEHGIFQYYYLDNKKRLKWGTPIWIKEIRQYNSECYLGKTCVYSGRCILHRVPGKVKPRCYSEYEKIKGAK